MNNIKTKQLVTGGMIAAIYVVLTVLAAQFNLASGAIQVRFSEALTILPVFTVAAVPGLAIGCVLANLLTGCAVWDVVFGSVATLIGAIGTRLLKNKPLLAWIPPVLSNMAIIPIILMAIIFMMVSRSAHCTARTSSSCSSVSSAGRYRLWSSSGSRILFPSAVIL